MTAAGRAAYERFARSAARAESYKWENRPAEAHRLWDDIAQAAVDAAGPRCPCGGMPGTTCGRLLIARQEEIERLDRRIADLEGRRDHDDNDDPGS